IDEMIDIYQVLAGKVRLRREPSDLAALVARGVAFVMEEARAQRQHVVLSRCTVPVVVHADAQRLQQGVNRLLLEASHSAPADARIDVALDGASGAAALHVALSEANHSVDALRRLLDHFSEDDDALERPAEGGLGIGLTLVQGLVKLQGGTVEVGEGA